jgi:hypothetical protein
METDEVIALLDKHKYIVEIIRTRSRIENLPKCRSSPLLSQN